MKKPKSHQLAAINAAILHFRSSNRGLLNMACGTGKTLTSLWIADMMKCKNLIVALPSLQLQEQIVRSWLVEMKGKARNCLVIGSDASIGKIHTVLTTTDSTEIADFLRKKGKKVVFTTYHSVSELIAACQETSTTFDMGIMDEADVTAGLLGKPFGFLLNDETGIVIHRRLFMTATPRFFLGEDVVSMDDETIYGKEFYRLSTAEAINSGILSPYKIILMHMPEPAKSLNGVDFCVEGLKKAIYQYELKKVISYHTSIKKAQQFTELVSTEFDSVHVNYKQTSKKRIGVIESVRNSPKPIVLSNSKALTFGFDLPECDCVALIDPRGSARDVAQIVGRILRKSPRRCFCRVEYFSTITHSGSCANLPPEYAV
jgi:predicted helicase